MRNTLTKFPGVATVRIPCYNSDQVAPQAKEKLAKFNFALPQKPPRLPSQKVAWKPPSDPSMFKINFNGVVFTEEKNSGIGVVIHDYQGSVIAFLAQLS